MKDTAPKEFGILAVAAVVGIIVGGLSYVIFGFSFVGAIFVTIIVAAIVMVALAFGWLGPKARTTGEGLGPSHDTAASTGNDGPPIASASAASATGPTNRGRAPAMGAKTHTSGATMQAGATHGQPSTSNVSHNTAAANAGGAIAGGSADGGADANTISEDHPAAEAGGAMPGAGGTAAATSSVKAKTPPQSKTPATTAAKTSTAKTSAAKTGAAKTSATPSTDKDAPRSKANAPVDTTAVISADPVDPATVGSKPTLLSAARDGGPDDLKMIKGVGPKMEGMLHEMGIYHFDQVAAWTDAEVSWVDANLKGFNGRVRRDEWVAQGKTLADGGATKFSSKVKKGGVY